jgi:Zn-dependent peptidase ImmA (M78 family)
VALHPAHQLNVARKRARATRERHGVAALGPVPDLVTLAEEGTGVPVVVTVLPEAVDGAYLPSAAGTTIFLSSRRSVVRQRFTLAHEIGHHVLGHASSVDDARALAADGGDQPMDERCANAFAAELLIPPAAAGAWVSARFAGARAPETVEDVVRFAAAFGVSAPMACIRLRTAKLVPQERADALLAALTAQEHLALYEDLQDLPVLDDTLARCAAGDGSRVPPAFAGSVGALRV